MTMERQPAGEDTHEARGAERHRARVISVETRRLERRLLELGPMPRERLARCCGAERWREGTFQEAVVEGVRTGRLRELPLGWIEASLDTAA
jgi:hypothetical protein